MPFQIGQTPFGIFDTDPQFQIDADRVLDYTFRKLGDPVMQVELTSDNIYASFEEACLEFSAIVNQYQAKSVLATLLGTPTGSLSGGENKYPNRLIELQKRLAEPYGEEAGLNGPHAVFSASVMLNVGQQQYDLKTLIPVTGSDGLPQRIFITEIFHPDPLAAFRFFGTTSAINYLNNEFSFESFTPETIFYLLPIWEDVLRGMQFKMSNKVRRSNYSYEMQDNVLTLYPVPQAPMPLFLRYRLAPDPLNPDQHDPTIDGVANLSNIPFGNITYSKLNSISKQWIRRFSFALAKEVLGRVRGKFQTIPIPNGDVTLDGSELISDARQEQDALRAELKEVLEETTYQKLIEQEQLMAKNLEETLKGVPLGLYIGLYWPIFFMTIYLFRGLHAA